MGASDIFQINSSIEQHEGGGGPLACRLLRCKATGSFEPLPRRSHMEAKETFAVSNCSDKFIFVTGGNHFHLQKPCRSAARFNLRTNQWERVPEMIKGRKAHSSCILGKDIYVFCGAS